MQTAWHTPLVFSNKKQNVLFRCDNDTIHRIDSLLQYVLTKTKLNYQNGVLLLKKMVT